MKNREFNLGDLVKHELSGLGIIMDRAYVETTGGARYAYGWRVSFLNGENFNASNDSLILMNEKKKK